MSSTAAWRWRWRRGGDGGPPVVRALEARLEEAVRGSAALLISSATLVGSEEAAVTMRARELALSLGGPVVFDPSIRLDRWRSRAEAAATANACVPGALLVRATAGEAALMTGEDDPERAALALLKAGARMVVITLGSSEGAILRGELRLDVDVRARRPSSARSARATSSPASSWPGWRRRRSTPRRWRRRCPRRWRRRRGRASGGARLNSWKRPTRRRVRAIRDRLRLVYGVPLAKPHGHPIAELILTVLSQSTNDRNRDVAYLALRERFPSWAEVRDAPVDAIEEAIRPGGISKVKSARIKSILVAITETAPAHASSRRSVLAGVLAGAG